MGRGSHGHQSVRPSVRPSIRPSVRPSIRPSVRPSVCPSLSLSLSLSLTMAVLFGQVQRSTYPVGCVAVPTMRVMTRAYPPNPLPMAPHSLRRCQCQRAPCFQEVCMAVVAEFHRWSEPCLCAGSCILAPYTVASATILSGESS